MKFYTLTCRTNFLLLAFISFLSIAVGQTEPQTIENLTQKIEEKSTITYADLVKLVIRQNVSGDNETVALGHIFGDYQGKVYRGKFQVNFVQKMSFKQSGRERMILLMKLSDESNELFAWQEMTVLALFETEDKPRLIDAIDVQADRSTYFSEDQPILKIGERDDAVLIVNHHFNAGESFTILSLVGAVENRFKIILDDINLKAISNCGSIYEEKASLTLGKNRPDSRRNLTVNYAYSRKIDGEDCGQKIKSFTKNFRSIFLWNVGRQKYLKAKTKQN